ncbi:hypothetical protein OH76DRAFT_297957 [Lentinus brumalis]|uniref:Uncharacterized protein n=1 Tax=Lentinus brumalis TaxID=2498619 RepID=A0A371DG36_9APHY|nr:hypothetical protein OH76DRAFT_297957 [Polyporus brumalis]
MHAAQSTRGIFRRRSAAVHATIQHTHHSSYLQGCCTRLHRERRTLFRRHVPPPIIAAGCPPAKARPARCYAPRCAAVRQDFFARILFVWLWAGGCFALHHPLPLRVQMVPFRSAPRTRTPEHADTGMRSPRTLDQTRARRRGVVLGEDEALDVPPPGSTIPRRPRTALALALLLHRP